MALLEHCDYCNEIMPSDSPRVNVYLLASSDPRSDAERINGAFCSVPHAMQWLSGKPLPKKAKFNVLRG